MSDCLETFRAQPRHALATALNGQSRLYALIDTVRQPEAAAKLLGLEGEPSARRLLLGTAYADLLDISPLWVRMLAGSDAAHAAASLCADQQAGILILCAEPEPVAFAHAQQLLTMQTPNGEVLARFYDPLFWSALAMTLDSQVALFGPWQRVLVPTDSAAESTWVTWERPLTATAEQPLAQPLHLGQQTLDCHEQLRWRDWLWSQRAALTEALSPERERIAIDNLRLLGAHGIQDGRHLQRLLPILGEASLADSPSVLETLRSDLPAHQKVQHVEGMRS